MKKFLILLITICSLVACSNKTDVGSLISLRNRYQAEYDVIKLEQEYRSFNENGYVKYPLHPDSYEEWQREKICKDSIEILNIEIEKYKNNTKIFD